MVPTIITRDEMIVKAEIVKASRSGQVQNVVEPVLLGAPVGKVLVLDEHRLLEAMVTAGADPAGVAPLNEGSRPRAGASAVVGRGPRKFPAVRPARVRRPGAAVGWDVPVPPRPGPVAVGRVGRQMPAGLAATVIRARIRARAIRARAGGTATEGALAVSMSGTGPRAEALGLVGGSPVHVPVARGSRMLRVGTDTVPTASVAVAVVVVVFAINAHIVQRAALATRTGVRAGAGWTTDGPKMVDAPRAAERPGRTTVVVAVGMTMPVGMIAPVGRIMGRDVMTAPSVGRLGEAAVHREPAVFARTTEHRGRAWVRAGTTVCRGQVRTVGVTTESPPPEVDATKGGHPPGTAPTVERLRPAVGPTTGAHPPGTAPTIVDLPPEVASRTGTAGRAVTGHARGPRHPVTGAGRRESRRGGLGMSLEHLGFPRVAEVALSRSRGCRMRFLRRRSMRTRAATCAGSRRTRQIPLLGTWWRRARSLTRIPNSRCNMPDTPGDARPGSP